MEKPVYKRLESLDVLRGFDLFCLVVLEMVLHPLAHAVHAPWFDSFMWGFTHMEWEGFSSWDLVMPLFMFMAGVSMPFALSRYKAMPDKMAVYRRIGKRVLLLWIFGMMCQGNLLALDPDKIYFYSNTLQAIAMGYLIAAILFLHVRFSIQVGAAAFFLLLYWAIMQFVTIDGYGGGNYTPQGNLAEWIDRMVLGRFRDGASVVDGQVVFAEWYQYTWILSSLNFGVTVLTGLFAGHILKAEYSQRRKLQLLFGIGVAMVAAGWLWGLQMPVIKKLWTSSMTLVSSGYCFLLMGLFYYWIDFKGHRKHITWLKVYGMNSILAYMLTMVVSFKCIGESLFFGLQQYLGNYYQVLIAICNVLVIYVILRLFYNRNIFLKV
ncbi:acyltransferase family protein [Parabacteroides bouchesdurhonensis]|uniref:acyltransferase family protein n=1 Tax=Parabacteroides bouchesdurhonensis TaxID=1936995 RepID=UPI000C86843B|nr:DUF5009 domain-containing protein [Parabacteroides bouchesdurhonensis]RHJ91768.1 DUF5009 domain-containing protein [Bacteroides sp. AM07-16]